ncbi:phytase [Kitasatospora sp. NPDC058170]|uniref:phytase n=1 Tax=Kitasatospora sp. NPDC058170 TaxID=3346364 RepID=UPI0036DC59BC
MRKLLHRTSALAAALLAALGPGIVPAAADSRSGGIPVVTATVETPSLFDDEQGGNANADDPAIWRNDANPDRSLVIATAKQGGLRVYDLDGRQVQSLPAPAAPRPGDKPGRFNNVDLVTGLRFPDGSRHDVAVVSDRGGDRIRIYRIDGSNTTGPLTDVTDEARAPLVFSADQDEVGDQRTAYGLATWTDHDNGRSYAVTSRRHGTELALAELVATSAGRIGYRVVRTIALPSAFKLPDGTTWSPCAEPGELPQIEGMVVDPDSEDLYVGQEDVGIWKLDADLDVDVTDDDDLELVEKVRSFGRPATYDPASETCVEGADPGFGGQHISADVEGLTIWRDPEDPKDDGYLLVSSQGDNTFAVFSRDDDNEFVRTFRVGAGTAAGSPDGSEECDGAAVTSAPLGRRFPHGLLVVQDGHNTPAGSGAGGGERTDTDFKFVDWKKVEDKADL